MVTTSLRCLTQNTCLLPAALFQSKGVDNRAQRAELIHTLVQRYDVVLLQEVFGCKWSSQWRDLFTTVPNMTSVLSTRPADKLVDSGLVILSRYPVLKQSFQRFRSKSFTNSVLDRGFLYAALQVGNHTVHVVNTHLNPSECHVGLHSPAEYRRRQLAEIQEFRAASGHAQEVWVIGGDFNDEHTVFRLTDCHVTFAKEQPPTSHQLVPFAIANNGPHKCIDYLASTTPQTYYRRLETLISDHYGVEAGVTVE